MSDGRNVAFRRNQNKNKHSFLSKKSKFFVMATSSETCECIDKWQYLRAAIIEKDQSGKTLVSKFCRQKKPEQLVANEVSFENM